MFGLACERHRDCSINYENTKSHLYDGRKNTNLFNLFILSHSKVKDDIDNLGEEEKIIRQKGMLKG